MLLLLLLSLGVGNSRSVRALLLAGAAGLLLRNLIRSRAGTVALLSLA